MMYALGVLFMVVGIGVSIALHEVGHLVPAKRFGVKCTQYMVGFGPTLFSRRRGETEYGIKAIPLGGYVRMIGMFPPRPGAPEGVVRASSTGRWSAMIDDARASSMEEVTPADRDRVFYKLSTPKKIAVMLGGPLMNLLIGTVLIGGLLVFYGAADPSRPLGAKIASVSTCVVPDSVPTPAGGAAAVDCSRHPKAPAYAAGLRPGDTIVSISGQAVHTPTDISGLVRPQAGHALPVVVERDGRRFEVSLTPLASTLPKIDAQGQPVLDATGRAVTERVGYMGTTTRPVFEIVPQPVSAVPGAVGQAVSSTAGIVLHLPQRMVDVWQAAFGSQERDPNGPVSVVGVGRIAGEKAGGVITGSPLDDIDVLPFLVQLLASLNIALFVFNLIPLMPLDGGHVAGALWEALKRGLARLLRRPDPGYVDVAKGLPVAYAVSIVLIGMSALLIYADLVKPVQF